jgi:transcriptional regulator with XRE-family HTH domain
MLENTTKPRLVATFIRERRKSANLSQRDLGKLFSPPVTTQFISNVERGITPLPLNHLPTLHKVLGIEEAEILGLMEKEYALKVSVRLGKIEGMRSGVIPQLPSENEIYVAPEDLEFMRALYSSYRRADKKTRQIFHGLCESVLNETVES